MQHFVLYRDAAGFYRWRIVSVNGQFLAESGEGYANKRDALHAARLVLDFLESEKAAGILKGIN